MMEDTKDIPVNVWMVSEVYIFLPMCIQAQINFDKS